MKQFNEINKRVKISKNFSKVFLLTNYLKGDIISKNQRTYAEVEINAAF